VDITATMDGGMLSAGNHSDTAKIELAEDIATEPTALEPFEQVVECL